MNIPLYGSLIMIMFAACNGGNYDKTQALADSSETAVSDFSPGSVATSKQAFYMSANIDGKLWTAAAMVPDVSVNSNYRMILGEDDDYSIYFQVYMPNIEAGRRSMFSSDNAVSFTPKAPGTGFWTGAAGDVTIISVNDALLEGNFRFTATSSSSDKKIEVTNGYFRLPLQETAQ